MKHSRVATALAAAFSAVCGQPAVAEPLPSWPLATICEYDSAPGQCRLFEARARSRVAEAWPAIPDNIRSGCLSVFRPPLDPSWRIMADCIGELSIIARRTVRKNAIMRDRAVAIAIKERRLRAQRQAEQRRRAKRQAERQAALRLEAARRVAAEAARRVAAEAARRAALKIAERQRIAAEQASFMARLAEQRAEDRRRREAMAAAQRALKQRQAQIAEELEQRRLASEEASFLTRYAVLKKRERAEAAERARVQRAQAAEARRTAAASASQPPPQPSPAGDTAQPVSASAGGATTISQTTTAAASLTPSVPAAVVMPKPETIKVEKPAQPAQKAKPAPQRPRTIKTAANTQASRCERRLSTTAAAGAVLFAFDSAELLKDAEITLDALAAGARACGRVSVTIEGHTDAIGTPEYNQRLSERRAENVANYLINAGVPANRVAYIGYGERRPVASNDTTQGRAKNRRIEYRAQ